MRKVCYILAAVFVLLGGVITLFDLKDTTKIAEKIEAYPVVRAADLDKFKGEDGDYVVVTEIGVRGTLSTDPKGIIKDKSFYYLHAVAEEFYWDYDDGYETEEWRSVSEKDYKVQADDLVNTLNGEKFTGDQVFYPPEIGTYLDRGVNMDRIREGDLRYTFRAIGVEDTMTCLMKMEKGELVMQTLLERDEEIFIVGNEKTYYNHVRDFVVGDSYLFIFLGVIIAIIFIIIGLICGKKKQQ